MKMRKTFAGIAAFMAVAAMVFTSCEKNNPASDNVSAAAKNAFAEKYPSVTNVNWSVKGNYAIAKFFSSNVDTKVPALNTVAWFDNIGGDWQMTESDMNFENLPEAVKNAFGNSAYAEWRIEDVDFLARNGMEKLYVIEVEYEKNGVEKEMDLYYSADGVLVKEISDAEDDYDYEDFLPQIPADKIVSYINEKYPDARIAELDAESWGTEVEIIDGNVARELYFDKQGEWMRTEYRVSYAALPDAVKNLLSAQYGGYEIDDIEFVEAVEGKWYLVELENESSDKELDLKIAEDGTVLK